MESRNTLHSDVFAGSGVALRMGAALLAVIVALGGCASQPADDDASSTIAASKVSDNTFSTSTSDASANDQDEDNVAGSKALDFDADDTEATPQQVRLIMAARYAQLETVRKLLIDGISLDFRDDLGYTALMAASGESSDEIQRLIVEQGADPNARADDGSTALMIAAGKGYLGHVERLVAAGARVNERNDAGETALMIGIRFGHADVVAALLDAGADANVYTQDEVLAQGKDTPLMYAAQYGASLTAGVRIVRLLLEHGAKPNVHRSSGETAMTIAKRRGYALLVSELHSHGARDESPYALLDREGALLKAIKLDDVGKVKELLALSADPNYRDTLTGVTPLLSAAYYGDANVVKLVVEAGAEVNDIPWGLRDSRIDTSNVPVADRELARRATHGDTPLIAAIRFEHADAAAVLLNHGARPELPNRDNDTPGLLAARNGMAQIVALLLEKGLDPNLAEIPEIDGYSVANLVKGGSSRAALIEAAMRGHDSVIDVLLNGRANPDIRDEEGRTALFWSASQGYFRSVERLLDGHADANIPDKHGTTPLMLAAKAGYLKMAESLINQGADVDAVDGEPDPYGSVRPQERSGNSALIFAARGGHLELVRLLLDHGATPYLHTDRGESAADVARKNGYAQVATLLETRSKR
ncbi:MAG: hypothetical protein GC138_00730 [Gammaproteobacteria bacterium]|nr:hypothetical protein [Gammaproteobacteria bacterium]